MKVKEELTSHACYGSLGQACEKTVMKLVKTEFRGWTMVGVTLRTIVDFDRVAILEDGVIAELCSPTLLQRGGIFKSLWDLQEFE